MFASPSVWIKLRALVVLGHIPVLSYAPNTVVWVFDWLLFFYLAVGKNINIFSENNRTANVHMIRLQKIWDIILQGREEPQLQIVCYTQGVLCSGFSNTPSILGLAEL